jgi:ribosome-associated toxin RatA of RatAB toxin-antitoxin module
MVGMGGAKSGIRILAATPVRVDILQAMKFLGAVLSLLCLTALPAPASAVVSMPLTVLRNGNQLSVEGTLITRANPAIAWSVLTDYEHFPAFVPGIRSNRVLETQGHSISIAQSGEVVAGLFRLLYDGTLHVEESPGESLSIEFVSGPFKDVRGEWRMEPVQNKRPLRLVYRMNMDMMKTPFPSLLASGIAEQQVRTWVDVFGREMDKRMDNQLERRRAK